MFTTPNPSEVRVWIVAGNPLARVGLSALLNRQSGLVVLGESPSDADLIAAIEGASANDQPDCLIWDVDWVADSTALASGVPHLPPILALVGDSEAAVEAWAAGAIGLLPRSAGGEVIGAAAAAVARRLTVLEGSFTAALIPPRIPALQEALTEREREVLSLMAEGLPNKTIAARLKISENTVKFHINAILGKLGAQSRTEAVVRAARLGVILL